MNIRENGKVFLVALLSGFFVGIIYANTISKDNIAQIGIFNEYFLNQYMQTEVDKGKYFLYLLRLRILPILFLIGAGYTKMRKVIVFAFLIWTGFLFGIIVASAIIKMGIGGMLFSLVALFPQMIFYVLAYAVLIHTIYNYPRLKLNMSKLTLVILTMCIGIVSECYLNANFMKIFLKIV